MTTPDEFDFNYGAEGASEAFANLKSGGGFRGLSYLSMKDGQSEILRFINDAFKIEDKPERVAWITIDQHSMVPTKPAPQGYQGKWPTVMGAVCRHAKAFRGKFPDCYICDGPLRKGDGKKYDASPRTWAIACLREEVMEGGRVIGIRDKTVEVPKFEEGKQVGTEQVKALVIVNLGYKNFFSIMEGFAGRYGTVLDRDYHITRKGSGPNDTVYQIAPLDKIPVDDNGRIYDLRDDEFFSRYKVGDGDTAAVPDLRKIVADRASDDYYGRFFDPRVSNAQQQSGDGQQQQAQQPAGATAAPPQGNDVDEARLASLRDRVKGAPTGDAPSEPAAEPAASSGGMRAL